MREIIRKVIGIAAAVIIMTVIMPFVAKAGEAEEDRHKATFTVVCEEGLEGPAEFVLTGDDGSTYTFHVSENDGYRRTEEIPYGNYTVTASYPDMDDDAYEIFADGTAEPDDKGDYHFYAIAGSWLYTVQNAGLVGKDAKDENGDPAHYGVIGNDEALAYMQAAEDTSRAESYVANREGEDAPAEFEEQPPAAASTSESPMATQTVPEPSEDPGKGPEGKMPRLIPALAGIISAFIVAIAVYARRRQHKK